jgi:tryptophan synthase alpha chain
MKRIENQFGYRLKSGEKLFIPYIMAGDGGLEVLGDRLLFLEKSGAAAIEIGVPFSDPVADGPTIQEAGIRALQAGTTLRGIVEELKRVRSSIQIPLIIMTYANPIIAFGIEQFCKELSEAGIDGCILPDLPIEEEDLIAPKLEAVGIELIRLVTLTTPKERIKSIAERGRGFLYTVTITGITGARNEFSKDILGFLQTVKEVSDIPVVAGFGISTAAQVKELTNYCDGVVVGSKIVDLFYENKKEEISELLGAVR